MTTPEQAQDRLDRQVPREYWDDDEFMCPACGGVGVGDECGECDFKWEDDNALELDYDPPEVDRDFVPRNYSPYGGE